ncbi:hypothetical protein [Butyrivibrio fibrisolvens]|uniref:hypothetical protein n=1 Tax=Butyrivibrio fibrisolvens TaxID=831 RepID=UPI0003FB54C9|nr:hypothetical protein [Butyrivibrio fibrisolvens]
MESKLKVLKRVLTVIFIVCISGVIGQLLLIGVYCLPTKPIELNIGRGAEILLIQGNGYIYADGYRQATLDNETDATMLSEALFPSESCIDGAVTVPRYIYEGRESQLYSLMAYLNHDDISEAARFNYSRYWHGYLTILKPFFSVFDYSDFKIINQAIQLVIIFVIIALMYKNHMEKFLIAFASMLIIWNPATIGVSLQYAACFYISMIGCIVVLSRDIKRKWLLFLILGILTSYFDFLTYPIVTFGIPLIFLILKDKNESTKPVISIFENGIYWGVGYLGMWASKWIIGTLISSENIIKDALVNIDSRTSTSVEGVEITRIGTVYRLLQATFFKWPYLIMFCGIIVYLLVKYHKSIKINAATVALVLISLVPIGWFIVTANHSYIHPRLVYRDWGISILALLSVPIVGKEQITANNQS